jgi:hypothetical protein
MHVHVDFNARDQAGRVLARVPADDAARVAVGQQVILYDPAEPLWADAVIARFNPETRVIACFVDWGSITDDPMPSAGS